MGNASLLDVFNGLTQVGNQALDIYSREKKYELDAKLYEQQISFATLQNKLAEDYLKIDPDGNNAFQGENGAQLYRNYVQTELGKWRDNALKAGNNSQYYNDNLHRMFIGGQANMEKKVYGLEVLAERQRMAVALAKARDAEINRPLGEGYGIGDKLNGILALGKIVAEANHFNILELKEWNDNAYTDALKNVAATAPLLPTTRDDAKYMREIEKAFPHDMPNRKALIDEAIGARQAQIQGRNQAVYNVEHGEYTRLMQEAKNWEQSGNTSPNPFISAARERYSAGIKQREYALGEGSSEYKPEFWDDIEKSYQWNEILGKQPAGTGKSKQNVIDALASTEKFWMDRTITGDAGFSITQGTDNYAEALKQLAESYGYTLEELDYIGEGKFGIGEFYRKAAYELNERYKANNNGKSIFGDNGEMANTIDAALADVSNQTKGMNASQKNDMYAFLQRATTNLIIDARGGNVVAARAKAQLLVEGLVERKIFSTDELPFNLRNSRGQNEFLAYLDKYGDLLALRDYYGSEPVGTDANGNTIYQRGSRAFAGGENRYVQAANAMREDFALRIGVAANKVQVVFDTDRDTPGDLNDPSTRFHFVVAGAGAKDGKYELGANENPNNPYIITKEGAPQKVRSGSEARKQNEAAQATETRRIGSLARLDEAANALRNGVSDSSYFTSIQNMLDNGQITERNIYAAGINWASKKALSKNDQESILKAHPDWQMGLLQTWMDKGIELSPWSAQRYNQLKSSQWAGGRR